MYKCANNKSFDNESRLPMPRANEEAFMIRQLNLLKMKDSTSCACKIKEFKTNVHKFSSKISKSERFLANEKQANRQTF